MSIFDPTVIVIVLLVVLAVVSAIAAMRRIKTCPSDRILVKYGQVGGDRMAKAIHGGTTFVIPVIQGYRFLDLTPMTVDIDLRGALSKQNIRVNVPSRFTFGIGTIPELMNNAAERLLSLDNSQVEDTAKDIIYGQLRATIAMMNIEEINGDREKFESRVLENIESELMKIGLRLINVNISDITDESGYIEALGQRAAAEAINQAKVQVAQQDRDGAVGSAQADQEQRVSVAEANARAVTGENQAKAVEASSQADLREAQAEAKRRVMPPKRSSEPRPSRKATQRSRMPRWREPNGIEPPSTPTSSCRRKSSATGCVPRPRARSRRMYSPARRKAKRCAQGLPAKPWAAWKSSPRWPTACARSSRRRLATPTRPHD